MDSMQEILTHVVTFTAALLLAGGTFLLKRAIERARENRKKFTGSASDLSRSLDAFNKTIESLRDTFEAQPRLVEGLTEVTRVQVAQLEQVAQVVKQLHKALFAQGSDGYLAYSEQDASQEDEIEKRMAADGITREQAESAVKEADVFRNMRITG